MEGLHPILSGYHSDSDLQRRGYGKRFGSISCTRRITARSATKKCKKCGKALSAEEIVKGYQFEPEQYVIVSADDLAKIKLKSTKVIEIEGFIDAGEIHPSWYESPYFAGPDGLVAAKAYSLLGEALKASGKVGVGKVVLREREEVVMIAPLDGGLILYKLRNPDEVRKMDNVPQFERKE